jgi:alpha-L-fucosidase
VPRHLQDNEKIQGKSQQVDDGEFASRINSGEEDLGSREVIRKAGKLVWYPAEVNTSIRPGWFYHPEEDGAVKSLDELLRVYDSSVGGNASMLLNIPPDTRGLIHENDAARLAELGQLLRNTYRTDLAAGAAAFASQTSDDTHMPLNVLNKDADSHWRPNEGAEEAWLALRFDTPVDFDRIVLMEHIQSGQRIEEFSLEYEDCGSWKAFYQGTVVGHKRICCFDSIRAGAVRLHITRSRWFPTVSTFGVFSSQAALQ